MSSQFDADANQWIHFDFSLDEASGLIKKPPHLRVVPIFRNESAINQTKELHMMYGNLSELQIILEAFGRLNNEVVDILRDSRRHFVVFAYGAFETMSTKDIAALKQAYLFLEAKMQKFIESGGTSGEQSLRSFVDWSNTYPKDVKLWTAIARLKTDFL